MVFVDDYLNFVGEYPESSHRKELDGLYNNMCREYLFTAKDKEKGADGNIYNSSHAVVHLIEGPLFFSATQLEPFDWTPQAGQ